MQKIQQKIDQLLIEAIDEVLYSLGEPIKEHIYDCLENDFSITKISLPQQIGEFSTLLQETFGPHARLVEIKCMRTFYSKIRIDQYLKNRLITWDDRDFTLFTYIDRFRTCS
jgi:hypothetical protein